VVPENEQQPPDTENASPPAPEDETDERLVARCQTELPDNLDAYHELVRRYEGIVFSTAMKMLGQIQEAEEVSQDSFLRVFHKIHQFEGRSTFKTWLFRIVCNFCLSRRKTLATRRERMESVGEKVTAEADAELDAGRTAAISQTDTPDELVGEALDQMKPEEQQIIVLRFISDLSLDQMSEVLDIGLSATKMRLYRAMESFRSVYSEIAENKGIRPTRGGPTPL
jgi:RNA polymerase sigma-70 factor (ECF subfamily)